jgi:recA bacterial DNA recombination protein
MASPAVNPQSSVLTSQPAEQGRAQLEALLRAKRLDRTLTTALPMGPGEDALTPFDIVAFDATLLGGLRRGHLSEIVGGISSGRTSLAWAWLAAATRRGETVALVDTFDRFDPASGAACGIDLSRMLWVRGQAISKTAGAVDPAWLPGARTVEGPGTMLERAIDRALKALNLVLQARVCTAVVLDMADVPLAGLRRIPMTTWLRVQRVIEGSDTTCVLLAPVPLARSSAGVTIATGALESPGARGTTDAVRWAGTHERSRRVAGLDVSARLSSPRRTMTGTAAVSTSTHRHRHITTSPHHIATSPHHIATSPHHITTSPHHIATSPHHIPTSPHRDITSPHRDIATSHHHISTSPHHITTSPHRHIVTLPVSELA